MDNLFNLLKHSIIMNCTKHMSMIGVCLIAAAINSMSLTVGGMVFTLEDIV